MSIEGANRTHIGVFIFIAAGNGNQTEVGHCAASAGNAVIVLAVNFGALVEVVRVIGPDFCGFMRRAIKGGKVTVAALHKHIERDSGQTGQVTPAFGAGKGIRGCFRAHDLLAGFLEGVAEVVPGGTILHRTNQILVGHRIISLLHCRWENSHRSSRNRHHPDR